MASSWTTPFQVGPALITKARPGQDTTIWVHSRRSRSVLCQVRTKSEASAAGRRRTWATAGQRATSRATTSRTVAPSWRGSAAPGTCPSSRPSRPPSSRRAPSYNAEVSRSRCSQREWGAERKERSLQHNLKPLFSVRKQPLIHWIHRGRCCETRGKFQLFVGEKMQTQQPPLRCSRTSRDRCGWF